MTRRKPHNHPEARPLPDAGAPEVPVPSLIPERALDNEGEPTARLSLLRQLDLCFPDRREPLWLYEPAAGRFRLCRLGLALLSLCASNEEESIKLETHCLQADKTRCLSFLKQMRATHLPTVETVLRFPGAGGKVVSFTFTGTRVTLDGQPVLYTGILTTEEDSRREMALKRFAFSDPLTTLPARNLFLYRVNVWLADWDPNDIGWMGTLSLDRYRHIRHLYGENRVNYLIQIIADRLSSYSPTLEVARSGGDEFLLAWHGPADGVDTHKLAQGVMELFREPCDMGEAMLAVSVSLGYTVFEAGATAEQAHLASENALQEAISAGGACLRIHTEADAARALRRLTLEEALHRDWEGPAFHLVYQPIYDVESGRYIGVEALSRWRNELHGTVSPAEFIPIAEESGLIVQLGYRILRTACMAGVALNAGGRRMTISVNASALQLSQPDFADRVMEILSWSGLPPERLQIEVTESLMLQDEERTSGVLGLLQAHGVRIALDDFGTGYSSLSYLKRLPLNVLKIDRAFVANLVENRMEKAIARSIISLSNILGLDVVAEGVETKEQLQALRGIGCSWIQGYFTGRPQPLEQLLELVSLGTPVDVDGLRQQTVQGA